MGMGSSDGDGANTILRVIVDNMLYPVSLETLHMVLGNFHSLPLLLSLLLASTSA